MKVPTHIAIIMDGNRRWAKEHRLPVNEGHRRVVFHVVENLVDHAIKRGIQYMTFWAWSTENWKRDKKEVETIMRIFRTALGRQWKRLHKKGVRIKVIGDISKFSPDIRKLIEERVEETKDNKKITAIFALNYGGRDELRRAVQKSGREFEKYLDTEGIPDPDMIIRPGGEQRLSGFLLWQSEYAELYFTKWYMPEFTPGKLDEVIEEYNHRQRRFGK
ncbi:di-trans,poly-cis-decaprenylcistransferase [Candidatus Gottesmanbacteria bacterium RIFCSPLOWO2_01_FULL_43_11b]|uniref:Isoprenyl transferase n=1 Tax=Candidatus Gottesmanbacteria bacterium RIFCSPLOWO2_01_FULL_43_11b TaxID=1798392 RepID=A0A1F6AHE2_9BACT|nr:MAG: di-trans,poly-cis-decaprenylcistransferase [Candidatus Gottesmanbacteria bacterium RIFCSPLOWO2_01_FULL_43_11b]